MASVKQVIIWIGVVISIAAVLIVGSKMVPLAEQGPGYVAKNLAFTMDAVSGAPEKTTAEYDASSVSFVAFEKKADGDKDAVWVSRFDICEQMERTIKDASMRGVKQGWEITKSSVKNIGDSIYSGLGFAVAEPPITGMAIFDENLEALEEQVKGYYYYRDKGLKYNFYYEGEPSADCLVEFTIDSATKSILNIKNGEDCNELLNCFLADPFYNEPKKIVIKKEGSMVEVSENKK